MGLSTSCGLPSTTNLTALATRSQLTPTVVVEGRARAATWFGGVAQTIPLISGISNAVLVIYEWVPGSFFGVMQRNVSKSKKGAGEVLDYHTSKIGNKAEYRIGFMLSARYHRHGGNATRVEYGNIII
jgi:hypothetical protein